MGSDYEIVEGLAAHEVCNGVCSLLKKGYKPMGSIATAPRGDGRGLLYLQAMYRDDDEIKEDRK